MKFRCPNCRHPIEVLADSSTDQTITDLPDAVTCPSCNSRFSLSDDPPTTVTPENGLKFAQFELRSIVGEGSFGTVYEAWDTELERVVALKVPRRGFVTEGDAAFLKEARMASGVEHPNIVRVYEIGQVDGQFYIASQFINGISLREKLRATQFSPRETAELLIPILRAVQAFHDRGIIHRDLKPANILLDTDGVPYVADFGLARRSKAGDLAVTQSGRVVGTILYMSPEQARGVVRELTGRTDVYAVGVILYEMLTGKRPFEATESRTVLYRIQSEEPKSPRRLASQVPRDLETICLKAIEKQESRRYDSAAAFADDLAGWLEHRPIAARPASVLEKTWKLIRRNRLVTVLLLGLLAALSWGLLPTSAQPPLGTVPVLLGTTSGVARFSFQRCSERFKVPVKGELPVPGRSDEIQYLRPGLYLVTALNDSGGTHTVWRTVPESAKGSSGDPRFWQTYSLVEGGNVVLPRISLFRQGDVPLELVRVNAGSYTVGSGPKKKKWAPAHTQEIDEFWMSRSEVTWRQFKEVLSVPIDPSIPETTFFTDYCESYDAIPPNGGDSDLPVTGFPPPVAEMFCELAGGRLPTNIQYDVVSPADTDATVGYGPWGITPSPQLQRIEATRSSYGLTGITSGVAEFTDSVAIDYVTLYPDYFPDATDDVAIFEGIGVAAELRGAPEEWVKSGNLSAVEWFPRQRLSTSRIQPDDNCRTYYRRIGWRLVFTPRPSQHGASRK